MVQHSALFQELSAYAASCASFATGPYTSVSAAGAVHDVSSRVMTALSATSKHLMDTHVILDLGCMKNVCGIDWIQKRMAHLKGLGRRFTIDQSREVFRFGDGERELCPNWS